MPSGVFDSILLKHLWGTDELRAIFNDENRVQKWFDYEAALALVAGRARHHSAGRCRRDRPQGQGRQCRPRGDRRRDPSHQAPAGAGAARLAGDLRRRPRRISPLRPDHAGRARYRRHAADQGGARGVRARPAGHRARAVSARRAAQEHADGRPYPCGAGAADHLRPQMRDLAGRDRPQPSAPDAIAGADVRRQPGRRGRHPGVIRRACVRARQEGDGAPRPRRRRHLLAAGARPSGRVCRRARVDWREPRQDRKRDHQAGAYRDRRARRAVQRRQGRLLDHAAQAQPVDDRGASSRSAARCDTPSRSCTRR